MREPCKMTKHMQTIRRLLPTICLSAFDHYVGLVLKGLKIKVKTKTKACIKIKTAKTKYDQLQI